MKRIAVLGAWVLLGAAPAAHAQSPTTRGYDESGVLSSGYDESGVLGSVGAGQGGDGLPFTGFDAGLVALMGAAMLGTGVAIRRSQRS